MAANGGGYRERAKGTGSDLAKGTHLRCRIREEEAGDPAATTARCPEPQERKARTTGLPGWLAASYFSGWNFCVARPQLFDNQISSLLPLTLTR